MNRMCKAIVAMWILIASLAHATIQETDTVRIDGAEYALEATPLDAYLKKQKWQLPKDAVISSSNRRGYIARWEIKNNALVVLDVTIRVQGSNSATKRERSILHDLFAPATVAEWYSGALIVPDGNVTQQANAGYESSYDHYRVFRIASGRLLETLAVTGSEFKIYQSKKFEQFSKTKEFEQARNELRKNAHGLSPQQLLDYMKNTLAERYLAL